MGADATIDLLDDILDTCECGIAKNTQVPMISCTSHRFNLAVQAMLLRHHEKILTKVHQLMTKLNTIKNYHRLREDALMLVCRNAIRWGSTHAMVARYFRVYDKLDGVDEGIADLIPTAREHLRLKALNEDIKNLESISRKLQTEKGVTLQDVRTLFDHVITHYREMGSTLNFENGVVKVLAGREQSLSRGERAAVGKLLRPIDPIEYGTVDDDNENDSKRPFADMTLHKRTAPIRHIDLSWVPPTSNDVERLFSRTGIMFSRLRRSLNPTTLETMLFLQYN
ncbi:Hypothetical protein PHPALM_9386 [Phytophthora palmivora]|uniref:HAT C-terminal dimerisation domain-containing protein n=1 Tax=Phytophthora palmivora TaxID=4796 RepID=A0A2P4Y7F1_9STRA|nr:Hypothetical protein PHPALM_9386 [Phytophthora palmivora]